MSQLFTLYVVNADSLPGALPGLTDQQKYETLVAAVEAEGARWEMLELREADFDEALKAIDDVIEGEGFLPVYSYNNSPGNLLGDDGDCPFFGYFTPEMVEDMLAVLDDLDPEEIEELEQDEVVEKVLHAYLLTAKEARQRGYAIAVVHA